MMWMEILSSTMKRREEFWMILIMIEWIEPLKALMLGILQGVPTIHILLFLTIIRRIYLFIDSKYKIILYLISRPRSGKQAREQRSKSIMSLFAGADEGGRGNVSSEEFNM